MYTGFIVKAGEITGNEIVDKSIKGFNYNNVDVICIEIDGVVNEIETFDTVKEMLNTEPEISVLNLGYEEMSGEELLERFLAFKNAE